MPSRDSEDAVNEQQTLDQRQKDKQDYCWTGPGMRGTEKRKKKDEKIVLKATIEGVANLSTSSVSIPNSSNAGSVSAEEARQRLRPFNNDLQKMSESAFYVYRQALELHAKHGKLTKACVKAYEQVETRGEDAIAAIRKKLVELKIHDIGFSPPHLPILLMNRAEARQALGEYYCGAVTYVTKADKKAYRWFKGCIDDTTESIMLRDALSPDLSTKLALSCLFMRGRSQGRFTKFEEALVDLRACCAMIRSIGPSWDGKPTLIDAMAGTLIMMAEIKIRDGTPRPHYTEEEARKIQRELGLGLYAEYVYQCRNCGAVRSSGAVKLSLCGRCRSVWFCSKVCSTQCWKNKATGHKEECTEFRDNGGRVSVCQFTRERREEVMKEIEERGFKVTSDASILMYDPETEELYDSLTNRSFK